MQVLGCLFIFPLSKVLYLVFAHLNLLLTHALQIFWCQRRDDLFLDLDIQFGARLYFESFAEVLANLFIDSRIRTQVQTYQTLCMAQVRYETAEHLRVQACVSQIYTLDAPVVPDQTANACAYDNRVVFLHLRILNLR